MTRLSMKLLNVVDQCRHTFGASDEFGSVDKTCGRSILSMLRVVLFLPALSIAVS